MPAAVARAGSRSNRATQTSVTLAGHSRRTTPAWRDTACTKRRGSRLDELDTYGVSGLPVERVTRSRSTPTTLRQPLSPTSITGSTAPCGDGTAPTVPGDLSASATQSSVTLTWVASTDNVAVAGYGLYRSGIAVGSAVTTNYSFRVSRAARRTPWRSMRMTGRGTVRRRRLDGSDECVWGCRLPGLANLWVDSSGGSCVRLGSPAGMWIRRRVRGRRRMLCVRVGIRCWCGVGRMVMCVCVVRMVGRRRVRSGRCRVSRCRLVILIWVFGSRVRMVRVVRRRRIGLRWLVRLRRLSFMLIVVIR